jgi:ABC-type hemin transport system ATPase subunit
MTKAVLRIEALPNRFGAILLTALVCGRVIATGAPHAITENEQVKQVYSGEQEVLHA